MGDRKAGRLLLLAEEGMRRQKDTDAWGGGSSRGQVQTLQTPDLDALAPARWAASLPGGARCSLLRGSTSHSTLACSERRFVSPGFKSRRLFCQPWGLKSGVCLLHFGWRPCEGNGHTHLAGLLGG